MTPSNDRSPQEAFALPLSGDRSDEDERRRLIEAEHPELAEALEAGWDEVEVDGRVMNPRLHVTVHEIVADQLVGDDPPEVWETALRLTALGHARHDVLHMLGSVITGTLWADLEGGAPADRLRVADRLDALPGSWVTTDPDATSAAWPGVGPAERSPRINRRTRRRHERDQRR